MFDLDIKKVQFENVYPKTENMLVSSELLANFNQDKHGIIFWVLETRLMQHLAQKPCHWLIDQKRQL